MAIAPGRTEMSVTKAIVALGIRAGVLRESQSEKCR